MSSDRPVAVRCPSCAAAVGPTLPSRCPACDVPVGGDTGRRLLEIDRRIATLTAERGDLLLRLRREAAIPDVSSVTPAAPRGARDVSTTTVGLPAIGHLHGWLASAGPQTLLAAAGVLLLAVAAVVFAAVTWRDLSLLTRAGVLLTASAAAAWFTKALVARGLRRTAEATGVLAVALPAVLLNGLWRAGLFDWLGGDVALTAAAAVLALVSHALARGARVRTPLVLAAWLAPAALVTGGQPLARVLAEHGLAVFEPSASLGAVLAGAATAAVYAERALRPLPRWRLVTQVAAAVLWLFAAVGAPVVLTNPFSSTPLHDATYIAMLLLVAAAVAAAAGARRLGGGSRWWNAAGVAGMWLAATLGIAGATVDRIGLWPDAPVVLSFAAAAAALRLLDTRRLRVAAVAGTVPIALMALNSVTMVGGWLSEILGRRASAPWMLPTPVVEAAVRAPDPSTVVSAAIVVAIATGLALALGRVAVAAAFALAIGGLLAVAVGVLMWPAAGGAVAALVIVAGTVFGMRHTPSPLLATTGLVASSLLTAVVALSTPVVTIAALVVAAAVTAAAIGAPGRYAGAVAAGVATADLVALAAAVAAATTDGAGPVAVAVAAAAAAGWAAAARLRVYRTRALAVEGTAAVALLVAAVVAGAAPAVWTATVHGVVAVAAAAVAVWRADRRWLRWLATAAASASSWTVLADLDVELVEAYTAPPALLIIALAAAELRARPDASSWPVLGSGLSLLTAPTFVQLVDDPGDLVRLAAVVALGSALVLAGRGWGLQSPLAIGVGALVTAALTQHGVVTDLLPRWLLLATGGCLLLWLSISYERQLQRMATARRRLLALR